MDGELLSGGYEKTDFAYLLTVNGITNMNYTVHIYGIMWLHTNINFGKRQNGE